MCRLGRCRARRLQQRCPRAAALSAPGPLGPGLGLGGQAPPPDGYAESWATGIERQNQLAWTDNAMKLWGHRENGTMIYRLFNISSDWYELNDLSASHPELLGKMQAMMESLRSTVFAPDRGPLEQAACNQIDKNHGFWGPWLTTVD